MVKLVVTNLSFAGQDIPIVSAYVEGSPSQEWTLTAFVDVQPTLPDSGWVEFAMGPVVQKVWGTVAAQVDSGDPTDPALHKLILKSKPAPEGAEMPESPDDPGESDVAS